MVLVTSKARPPPACAQSSSACYLTRRSRRNACRPVDGQFSPGRGAPPQFYIMFVPMPRETLWPTTPLKRCLEILKLARQIGDSETIWLAHRAINTYMESAGPNYQDKMLCLEALRISWRRHTKTDAPVLILNYIESLHRGLRAKAKGKISL